MSAVRTTLVTRDHAWTGEDVPWRLDTEEGVASDAPDSDRAHRRLFRLLSGGGLAACGTSNARTWTIRRQSRFLVFAGFLGVLWVVFWIV